MYKSESEIDSGLIDSAFKFSLFFVSLLAPTPFLSPLQGPPLFLTIVVVIVFPQFLILLIFLLRVLVVIFLSFVMSSFAFLRSRDIRPSLPGMFFFCCCFHSWLRLTFLFLEPISSVNHLVVVHFLDFVGSLFLLTFLLISLIRVRISSTLFFNDTVNEDGTLNEEVSNMCWRPGPEGMSDGVMTPRKTSEIWIECSTRGLHNYFKKGPKYAYVIANYFKKQNGYVM